MAVAVEVPWVKLAALGGAALALTLAVRGGTALVGVAVGEVSYRAADPDAWLKWLR